MFVKVRKGHQAFLEPGWLDPEEKDPIFFDKDQVIQILDEVKPETTRYYSINTLRGIRYVDGSLCSLPRPTRKSAEDA